MFSLTKHEYFKFVSLHYRAYPIDEYPARCRQAAALMHMIMNNLDPRVAQFPQELVTYGGNGQVFSNWAQVDTSDLVVLVVYMQIIELSWILFNCQGYFYYQLILRL
jgi:hypothetical protein